MKRTFQNMSLDKLRFGSPEFRAYFRSQLVNNYPNGKVYVISYVLILVLIISFLSYFSRKSTLADLIFLPLYLMFNNIFEYVFHRYPMHHRLPFLSVIYQHVTVHHNFYANHQLYFENDKDYYAVIIPYWIWMYFVLSSSLISVLIYLTYSFNQSMLFLVTVYLYYLVYELLHFSYHAPEHSRLKRLPILRYLAQVHLVHHRTELMTRYNFNITFPICDFLFGTLYREIRKAKVSDLAGTKTVERRSNKRIVLKPAELKE